MDDLEKNHHYFSMSKDAEEVLKVLESVNISFKVLKTELIDIIKNRELEKLSDKELFVSRNIVILITNAINSELNRRNKS